MYLVAVCSCHGSSVDGAGAELRTHVTVLNLQVLIEETNMKFSSLHIFFSFRGFSSNVVTF